MFRLTPILCAAAIVLMPTAMAVAQAPNPAGVNVQNTAPTAEATPAQIAQSQQTPAQSAALPATNAVGTVATVRGASIVLRGDRQFTLRVGNEIFRNDVLQTGRDGLIGVAFDDETTLTLSPNTRITVTTFVYAVSGSPNVGRLSVARGTLTFFAGQVAKTGDMRISTPSASLGIRGTTGIVNVPATQGSAETRVKLYADQNGTVGRIDVFAIDGTNLGQLSQPETGLAVRLDAALSRSLGQPRYTAAAVVIAPQEVTRDRSELQQLNNVRTIGRQINDIRRRSTPPGTPQ